MMAAVLDGTTASGEYEARLVECAHEILARAGVDPGLAADGGIHHAEHGGRNLDDRHAAQPGRGDEAGAVAGIEVRVGELGFELGDLAGQVGDHPSGILAEGHLQGDQPLQVLRIHGRLLSRMGGLLYGFPASSARAPSGSH